MRPGDGVIVLFVGAQSSKLRPAVILSSELYHRERPDLIVGLITSNLTAATNVTDVVLEDWRAAGLRQPSVSRFYLGMLLPSAARLIGQLSQRDWDLVRARVPMAFA